MSDVYHGQRHRTNLEMKLGRKLRKGEVADHIDMDKNNDSPANLRPMPLGEHSTQHGKAAKRHTGKLVNALSMVKRGEKLYP
jgi:hypothetical protein